MAAKLPWVEDSRPSTVRLIECRAARGDGLLAPAVSGALPVLAPVAAAGLALVMMLAMTVRRGRGEPVVIAFNAAMFSLAAVTAWGRFGPFSFYHSPSSAPRNPSHDA